jgi:hypothetical protein
MIKLEHKKIAVTFTDNLFFTLSTDFIQLWGKWNWYSFTFIQLEIENDKMTGGFEIMASLLGFHFFGRWNYKPEILEKMLEEAEEEFRKLPTISDEELRETSN